METVLQFIPALIRMTLVFILVLVLIRKNLSLGNAFMLGSLCLGLLFAMPPGQLAMAFLHSAIDPKTLALATVVTLILVLSQSMDQAGQLQRLLAHFRGLLSTPRLNLVLFPALIGLLPMPGGAVFSAPMVKELGAESGLNDAKLSFVNYWFRHIWEYWWPLYPGVLIATLMADINLPLFVAASCPLTIVAMLLGSYPIRNLQSEPLDVVRSRKNDALKFLTELVPIVLVIVPGLGLGVLFSKYGVMPAIAKEAGLILSLCLSIGWLWHRNRFSRQQIASILNDRQLIKMIYMIMAILVFKGVLNESRAVSQISGELVRARAPLFVIVAMLPFLVGLFTGITVAFVGSTFPILISLIHSLGQSQFILPYMVMALTVGFAGVLLSPLHLCLLLSNEYFETPAASVYKFLWLPCIGLAVAGCGYCILLQHMIM